MKSPFPGMDPYLEEHWRDVHHRFLTYACDELQPYLPSELRARLEERVFVEPQSQEGRGIYPDVRVIEYPSKPAGRELEPTAATIAAAEPIVVSAEDEPATEGYIEVVDLSTGYQVVTAIELLSISNKLPGEGQEKYLRKQQEYRRGRVSLVEIDLLRSGQRVTAVPKNRIPPSHRTTYHVCVSRGWRPGKWEIYRLPLRERLPAIRIPLRQSDADAPLDLQLLIDRCYHNGRYDDLNYRIEPNPPLESDDAAWAREMLSGNGLR